MHLPLYHNQERFEIFKGNGRLHFQGKALSLGPVKADEIGVCFFGKYPILEGQDGPYVFPLHRCDVFVFFDDVVEYICVVCVLSVGHCSR